MGLPDGSYRMEPSGARCPACHATRSATLYTVGAEEAAQHYVRRELHPERHDDLRAHVAALWGGPTCDVVRCGACGFGFADPYVAGDEAFYTLAYDRTGYPDWKWEYERTLDVLRPLRAASGEPVTLLEVGAGDGAFVRRVAPALTPKDHVVTTEFSAYGRREIERHGIECLDRDVRDLPLDAYGGRFDVLCLFQVLEHLDRLDALFEHLGALAAPAAHLFIAVPNDRRITFNERSGALLDLPPNHIGRWTRPAFGAVADRHGWRIEAHDVEPEGAGAKAANFAEYRYMRVRQSPGSLAQRAERLPSPVRRPAQAALAVAYAFARPRALAELVRAPDLGNHQWVHLSR